MTLQNQNLHQGMEELSRYILKTSNNQAGLILSMFVTSELSRLHRLETNQYLQAGMG